MAAITLHEQTSLHCAYFTVFLFSCHHIVRRSVSDYTGNYISLLWIPSIKNQDYGQFRTGHQRSQTTSPSKTCRYCSRKQSLTIHSTVSDSFSISISSQVYSDTWPYLSNQNTPFSLLCCALSLISIKYLEDDSINSFIYSQQLISEHNKNTSCLQNSPNPTAVVTVHGSLFHVDFYNRQWERCPFNAKGSDDILKVISEFKICGDKSISAIITEMANSITNKSTAFSTFQYIHYDSSAKYYFQINISLMLTENEPNLAFIQFIDNTDSIQLSNMKTKDKMMNSITH